MSTKLWIGQHLRIEVRNRKHNPPHVHAMAKGAEAVIDLKSLRMNKHSGFNKATLKITSEWVKENQELLLEVWENEQKKRQPSTVM